MGGREVRNATLVGLNLSKYPTEIRRLTNASLCARRQCGKEFKPQELHAHMQSCRGFRERMRSSASASAQPGADGRRASTAGHRSADRPSSASAVFLLAEP